MSKTKYRFTYDDDEDREDNKTGELASRIGAVLAHRAVDNLMTIAENLTVETMVAITKYLLSMDAERLVSMPVPSHLFSISIPRVSSPAAVTNSTSTPSIVRL